MKENAGTVFKKKKAGDPVLSQDGSTRKARGQALEGKCGMSDIWTAHHHDNY